MQALSLIKEIIFLKNDLDSSLIYFQKSITEQGKAVQDWKQYFYAHCKISEILYLKGKKEVAEEIITKALTRGTETFGTENPILSILWNHQATNQILKGEYEKAILNLKRTIKLLNESEFYEEKIRAQINLGKAYFNKKDTNNAVIHLTTALIALTKTPIQDTSLLAEANLENGYLLLKLGQLDTAEYHLQKTIDLLNNQSLLALWANNHLFELYFQRGNPSQFTAYMLKAVEIAEQLHKDDFPLLMSIYRRAAVAFLYAPDFHEAINYSNRAISVAKKYKDSLEIARNQSNMGNAYWNLRQLHKAIDFKNLALPVFINKSKVDKDVQVEVLSAHNDFGLIYMDMEDYSKSRYHQKQSLRIKKERYGELHEYTANSYFNLGQLEIRLENYDEAEKNLYGCLNIIKQLENVNSILLSNTYYQLGEVFLKKEAYEKALNYYQQSIQTLAFDFNPSDNYQNPDPNSRIASIDQILYPLHGKAKIFSKLFENSKQQDYHHAVDSVFKVTAALIYQIFNSYEKEASKELIMDFSRSFFETIINHQLNAYKQNKDSTIVSTIFELIEKSKAVLLKTAIDDSEAKFSAHIPISILEREEQIKKSIGTVKQRLLSEINPDSLQLLNDSLFRINRVYDQLVSDMKREYPQYYQLKYDNSVTTIKEIQIWLTNRPSTGLIQYYVGDQTLVVIGITNDQVFLHSQVIDSSFIEIIQSFRENLMSESINKTTYINHGYKLYEYLMESVLEKMDTIENLVIIPDGMIGYLPLENLISSKPVEHTAFTRMPYLLWDYNIRYEYAATLLLNQKKKTKPK